MSLPLIVRRTVVSLFCLAMPCAADPVTVRHVQGFIHGFLVVKDLNGKIVGSGSSIQQASGSRVTTVMTLHFRDGSQYEETAVFSQLRTFRLLRFRQVMRGPSFKVPETTSFDATTGKVTVDYVEKGKEKVESKQASLPPDLANGIVSQLLTNIDPKAETSFSMLVTTPQPRVVKLRISPATEEMFSIAGAAEKANHFVIKIDPGPVAGVIAKVAGKNPPDAHVWISAGNAPVFLKSESQFYEDGPVWRIELASPTWPAGEKTQ